MSDYGSAGMPKVVVVGNYDHHVYYNANNSVNATALSTAITTALQDFSVGISEPLGKEDAALVSFPNPVTEQVSLTFSLENAGAVSLTIFNDLAKQVISSQKYTFSSGKQTITINAASFENGIYYARIQTGSELKTARFVVLH
jgi:hypothetical protein